MSSNNSKYTQEMREQTARHILETGKSATRMAEELGIDVNTVCRWVRDYRRAHGMPSYAEAKEIVRREPKTEGELVFRIKELEKELKKKEWFMHRGRFCILSANKAQSLQKVLKKGVSIRQSSRRDT